jgi:hypothetical protein
MKRNLVMSMRRKGTKASKDIQSNKKPNQKSKLIQMPGVFIRCLKNQNCLNPIQQKTEPNPILLDA